MEPTKDETHAIVELVDVLLCEGAVIEADVIVTVAGVPLIGISLRAVIAGMTTMTEYGLFEEWDTSHRQSELSDGQLLDHRPSKEASNCFEWKTIGR